MISIFKILVLSENGCKVEYTFRKIGIMLCIYLIKISIRNGYVFEAWMALP